MFTPTSKTAAREEASTDASISTLTRTAHSWYDGSVESVENRSRLVSRVASRLKSADHPDVETIAALDNEVMELDSLRTAFLQQDQQSAPETRTASTETPLSAEGREFVATQLNQFLADNTDAIYSAEELDIRAANYADLHTSLMTAEDASATIAAFRTAAAAKVEKTPARREASVRSDLEDGDIFL